MLVLIRKARIVDPQSDFHDKVVDLLIEDGIIKDISTSPIQAHADTIIEAEDLHVSPGWVDLLADYSEPGFEQKETIHTGLNAAAAGGFTDVLLAPNTHPAISNTSGIQYVLQRAQGHVVNLRPLGAISQNIEGKTLAEMLDMHHSGAIAFTDGWKPVQNSSLMLKALEYVKAFDGTLIQIPVDTSLSADGLMHEGPVSTGLGMPGIPALAETILLHRDIELLRYTNANLHVSGITTAGAVEMVRAAKAEGLSISCSVTPYHLALTDEALLTYNSLYKVMPPLREEADRQALIAGLSDGTIDCIAAHHRPQEWDAKAKEFEYAADGMNVQEIVFNIIWNTLSSELPLATLVRALSTRPRELFKLLSASIGKGNMAEITIFTTAGRWTLDKGQLKSQSKNNPFIGREMSGKVLGIINHNKVYLNK